MAIELLCKDNPLGYCTLFYNNRVVVKQTRSAEVESEDKMRPAEVELEERL